MWLIKDKKSVNLSQIALIVVHKNTIQFWRDDFVEEFKYSSKKEAEETKSKLDEVLKEENVKEWKA